MNIIIKNLESPLRDTEAENIYCTTDVDHLNLIIQLLEMLDTYKQYNSGTMPGTITDLIEWNNTPQEEIDLPFS